MNDLDGSILGDDALDEEKEILDGEEDEELAGLDEEEDDDEEEEDEVM